MHGITEGRGGGVLESRRENEKNRNQGAEFASSKVRIIFVLRARMRVIKGDD
jgi:hypothetical protein